MSRVCRATFVIRLTDGMRPQRLDRWKFTAYKNSESSKSVIMEKVFMNYFGIGVDAMIAMTFDSARKRR